ncbi:DUF4328 domain-containing protein [Lentzea sp. NPDC006480]|uniref:DUF4328 domain-containing protein n=1 Tax=Lentzea sp. NPDC006480 TaxID=3157176 RepID=UPI0033AAB0FE
MSAVRSAHGVGTAATGLIAFAAGTEVVTTVLLWVSPAEPMPYWVALFAHVVAGVVFISWMSQARLNSDVITSKHQHRYTNMWVFVGWIIPLANLFIPYAVMQDIWRGSDRSQPMTALRERPFSGLVRAWWATFIAGNLVASVPGLTLRDAAAWGTLSAALGVAAAVLAARMIKQLNAVQVGES